eukprot:11129663-Karenia_brevis.AAC.1
MERKGNEKGTKMERTLNEICTQMERKWNEHLHKESDGTKLERKGVETGLITMMTMMMLVM